MSGGDVEVICGEWEIGDASMTSSEEKYNTFFVVQVKCEDIYGYNNIFRRSKDILSLASAEEITKLSL